MWTFKIEQRKLKIRNNNLIFVWFKRQKILERMWYKKVRIKIIIHHDSQLMKILLILFICFSANKNNVFLRVFYFLSKKIDLIIGVITLDQFIIILLY